jgi:hypothetical protein
LNAVRALYVLEYTFYDGFESHSLRHVIETKQVALNSDPLSGLCFLFGVSDMQFCRAARCDPLRLKPTDWESVFDRQRKNFADPGNASACASPTAALLLEGRTRLPRLLQEIPLGEAEQAAAEYGVAAYENLLSKLSDVPTPAGPTPR